MLGAIIACVALVLALTITGAIAGFLIDQAYNTFRRD
jgi:hypothetical protein